MANQEVKTTRIASLSHEGEFAAIINSFSCQGEERCCVAASSHPPLDRRIHLRGVVVGLVLSADSEIAPMRVGTVGFAVLSPFRSLYLVSPILPEAICH